MIGAPLMDLSTVAFKVQRQWVRIEVEVDNRLENRWDGRVVEGQGLPNCQQMSVSTGNKWSPKQQVKPSTPCWCGVAAQKRDSVPGP